MLYSEGDGKSRKRLTAVGSRGGGHESEVTMMKKTPSNFF